MRRGQKKRHCGVLRISDEQLRDARERGSVLLVGSRPEESMLAVPHVLLSGKQWKAAAEAMSQLARKQRGNGLVYTTADVVAVVASVSVGVARAALRKLRSVGILRHHPASGSRPEMFMPAAWP